MSASDEWYTPSHVIEPARRLMDGIDLDPASCETANRTVQAKRFYTEADDGLSQPWSGRVWLNPPYSQPLLNRFVAKLLAEHDAGHVAAAVLLVNAATDTVWFQTLAGRYPVLFSRGRVRFWRSDRTADAPRFGQALFAVGLEAEDFRREYDGVAYGTR